MSHLQNERKRNLPGSVGVEFMWEDMRHTGGPEAKTAFLLPFLLSLCFLLGSQTGMAGMAMRMWCTPCLVKHSWDTGHRTPLPLTGQNRDLTSGICLPPLSTHPPPPFPLHENSPHPKRPDRTCHPCQMSWPILITVPRTPSGIYRLLWFPA